MKQRRVHLIISLLALFCTSVTACGPGYFRPYYWAPHICGQCLPGKYQPNWNQGGCYSCPSGKTSPAGSTSYSNCAYSSPPPPPPPPLSPPTGSAWRSKLVPRESEEYRLMIDSNGAPDRKLRSARDSLERAGRVDRSISIHMKTPPDVRPPTSSPYTYHPPPSIPTS